ncbi:serine hydrolase domain-containing protein [Bowmanella dokdonensis]|uniref:Serine hydrolase n=1 Tax=Bowmanella dokdonensis TaxID=751969 RepID=A0A939IMV0_9ALTE|nr:serine hydrolase [Bowmanella dokdonensis]MBN7825688.1 serine hydrolase [Bowmanella dokdonensis]
MTIPPLVIPLSVLKPLLLALVLSTPLLLTEMAEASSFDVDQDPLASPPAGQSMPIPDYPALVDTTGEGLADASSIDELMVANLQTKEKGVYSGAVVLIAHRGQVLYEKAFGYARQIELHADGILVEMEQPVPMRVDSVFDLASVTKVASTTAALMHLVSRDQLSLDDRLGTLLPRFEDTDKSDITLRQLLTHRSGLWQWQPAWLYRGEDEEGVLDYIASLPLRYPVGEQRAYSDLGFILLGKIIERASGQSLDEFVLEHIHRPLGMLNTQYRPPASWFDRLVATSHGNPYEQHMIATGKPYPLARPLPFAPFTGYRQHTLVGQANDGNAWYGLDGVAGHAGLFGTARDLAVLAQTLLNGGVYDGYRLADPATLGAFLQTPFDENQALGWWKTSTPDGHPAYWHPGFTGTQILFQPHSQLIILLLTNRQHGGLDGQSMSYPSVSPVWKELLRLVNNSLESR